MYINHQSIYVDRSLSIWTVMSKNEWLSLLIQAKRGKIIPTHQQWVHFLCMNEYGAYAQNNNHLKAIPVCMEGSRKEIKIATMKTEGTYSCLFVLFFVIESELHIPWPIVVYSNLMRKKSIAHIDQQSATYIIKW